MITVETWPVDKIIPYDRNAKLHHVEWIAQSISEFSIDQPIVVDGQGVIIKGPGRLKAAKSIGLTEFPVVVRNDLTPEQIRLARIADNRSAEGGWDSDLLGAELNDLLNAMPDYDFDSLGLTALFDNFQGITPVSWEEGFDKVPEEDRQPFQQMTFTVHDSQVEAIQSALEQAKKDGKPYFETSENQNSNGNALAFICLSYGKR